MFVMFTVAPLWIGLIAALSAFVTAVAFWKPTKPKPEIWDERFDHEARYAKLQEKLGWGKD